MLNRSGARTGRLWLDRPAADDLPALHALHADPRTNRHNPAGPATDLAQSRTMLTDWMAHWDRYGFGYWAVRDRPAGKVVGAGGVRYRDVDGARVLNLYYRFAVTSWGRGYATELAVEAASRRVAERTGPHLVGRTEHHGGERLVLSTRPC